jgi:hypothetical protein
MELEKLEISLKLHVAADKPLPHPDEFKYNS